jgi:hypothetical protein
MPDTHPEKKKVWELFIRAGSKLFADFAQGAVIRDV